MRARIAARRPGRRAKTRPQSVLPATFYLSMVRSSRRLSNVKLRRSALRVVPGRAESSSHRKTTAGRSRGLQSALDL